MPELPEVETVVRTLAPVVRGRTIVEARFLSPLAAGGRPEELAEALRGRRIVEVRRRGKFIVFELDHGVMTVHLRMTGKLLTTAAESAYARAVFQLDDGEVVFDDVRQFGRVEWAEALPENVARLGPEPLSVSLAEFSAGLKARPRAVKPLLLDQSFVAGLGNIYVDECLHRAGIHPLARASRIGRKKVEALHASMREVLGEAIAAGGSSISDYADAQGRAGWFQRFHRVYGREGEACMHCGGAIQRIVVGQRGTHFCPRCQKR